jgi:transposase-like protein
MKLSKSCYPYNVAVIARFAARVPGVQGFAARLATATLAGQGSARQARMTDTLCLRMQRGDNFGGVFALAIRVSYPLETKLKAIEMRTAGIPVKEVMAQLNIRNRTQLKTWMQWYKRGEMNRLEQPVGKQYTYGKGPEYASELEQLKAENRFLKQQLDVLKKYKEMERRCHQGS